MSSGCGSPSTRKNSLAETGHEPPGLALRSPKIITTQSSYSSSTACMRPPSRCYGAFEAYVRGQWLAHCATDGQVEKYLRDWSPPKIDDLLAAVEKTPGFSEQVLSRVKAKGWDTMCAYTHTGGLHIQRWNTSDGIEQNYSLEELLDVLAFAEFVGVMSVLGIAELANDEDLALRLLDKIKERAGK